jgi:hypothetical protein
MDLKKLLYNYGKFFICAYISLGLCARAYKEIGGLSPHDMSLIFFGYGLFMLLYVFSDALRYTYNSAKEYYTEVHK